MSKLMGLRTFIITILSIIVLLIGVAMVNPEHRKDVFVFFSGALVGLAGVQGAKSVGSAVAARRKDPPP